MILRPLLSWAFFLLLLTGCVVIQQGGPQYYSRVASAPSAPSALDLLFARYPLNIYPNDPLQSIYITAIDEKSKTVVNIILDSTRNDFVFFTAQLLDFDKSENITLHFYFSTKIVMGTQRSAIGDKSFKLSYSTGYNYATNGISPPPSGVIILQSSSADTGVTHLFYDVELSPVYHDIFYTCSGKMINEKGRTIRFWGQADIPATTLFFSVISLSSYMTEKRNAFIDLCDQRKVKMNKLCDDQHKKVNVVKTFNKPLFRIGDFPILDGIISDCEIICQ